MKIALIGLGKWGKNHARALSQLKNDGVIDKLYFYDVNKEILEKMSKLYNAVPIYESQELLNLNLDGVDIAVPANLHYEVAKPFIENGINVLIEKPFTDQVKTAEELVKLSEDPEKKIMVGHLFRFHPAVVKAKYKIESGTIGHIRKIDIRRLAFAKPRPDNGVIFSLAIHDLELINYLSGRTNPDTIHTIASEIYGPTEDHVIIKSEYNGEYKITGILEESWMHPTGGKVRTCSIQGELGEIFIDFTKSSELIINSKYLNDQVYDNGTFTEQLPFKEPLKEEIMHFIEATRNGEVYRSGPSIGLNAVKLCEAAIKSAELKQSVKFD